MSEITLAVDAMGGDNAPSAVLDGCAQALSSDPELTILLCGPADVVEPFAAAHERCEAVIATQVVEMGEHPAQAVRKKKDSSINVGCKLVKEGRAAGFFSAGSTGACLAAATLVMGRIRGVARPALATVIPAPAGSVLLCDVGANADCKPSYLVQFAQMGSAYAEYMMDVEKPRVAQLNIGEEDAKGSAFAQEANALMKECVPNYVGNAEGGDVMAAKYDVFVCDGFTGNVALKIIEGTAKQLFKAIKGALTKNLITKLGAVCVSGGLRDIKNTLDPDLVGGAPLLGVKGACIIGHGSSSGVAIKNGIATTAKLARSGYIARITSVMEQAQRNESTNASEEGVSLHD